MGNISSGRVSLSVFFMVLIQVRGVLEASKPEPDQNPKRNGQKEWAIKFEPQQFDAATSIFESENIWVSINRDPNF